MLRKLSRAQRLPLHLLPRRPTKHATRRTQLRPKSTTSTTISKAPDPASLPKEGSRTRSFLRGIYLATSGFLVYHIVANYVLDYGLCDGISMLPTFNSFGDAVLISKYYRRGRSIRVGDVVTYKHPLEPQTRGLKRVVGLAGDFVLRDTPGVGGGEGGEKMLQVRALNASLILVEWVLRGVIVLTVGNSQVPEGHCWIAGDNLQHSRDSRTFGPLPMALIKGKAIARFDPWWKLWAPIKLHGLQEPELDDEVD